MFRCNRDFVRLCTGFLPSFNVSFCLCCQIFAKFISPKRWSNGNRKYTLSSQPMPWRCRFSWKWSALPSKPRNHLTTTFQMRTKASITTQRISIGGNYVPVLLLLLRMFSFVSSNFVPFNFRYQSHWNVHSNAVCIIKCRYFFPIIIFVVVWFGVELSVNFKIPKKPSIEFFIGYSLAVESGLNLN